jgi:hypothetical protein
MIPRYHLELICEDADRLVYEESANYGDAFTCLCIGIILLAIAIIGIRLGAEDLTRRKFLSTSFVSGFGFCVVSTSTCPVLLAREMSGSCFALL